MAKNPGKAFEEDFKKSIPDRCDVTRLYDAGGWSGGEAGGVQRFTPANPCDLIIFARRLDPVPMCAMYKLELKSLKGKSLPLGNIKSSDEKRLKFVAKLVASEVKGVKAGFIVNFRDTNETFFVLASKVAAFLEAAERASIPITWFRENGLLIKQKLKIKRYGYDLEWM
jgi:recombination protein U